MKYLFTIIFFLFTYITIYSQSCTHTIRRTDTFGDGWNGGTVAVSVNGVTVLSGLSCVGLGPTTSTFTAAVGATIRVYRTAAGLYPTEMRIQVLNGAGSIIINTIQPVTGTATTGGQTVLGSCAAAAGPCTNTSSYGSAIAPSTPTTVTISTCQYQAEYSTITSCVAGQTYQSYYNLGGYITVRSGTYNGTVVTSGNSPLNWVCPSSGTYFVHYNTNNTCGTASSCGTSSISCLTCSAPTPPSNDLVCNSTSITCGQTLSGTTVNATNSGTGENGTCTTVQTMPGVWYSVTGNGQIMTASLCATAWDSKIGVFSGPNCSTLTCVGGNDDYGPACASTSASYSWTSTVGTIYYIVVHGYSSNSSFSVNLTCVSPPPLDPSSISATQNTICDGSSTTLTANGAIGVVYWYTGGCASTFLSTGNSISVSPSSTTTYYAKNLNGGLFSNGCASVTITVNPNPTVTINAVTNTICNGSNTQLISSVSNTGGSPITYLWTPSTGLSNSAAPSPFASPTTTQTYQLTATANGCSTSTSSTITVNPTVGVVSSISGNNTIIAGTQETYSITPIANVTYQWAYTESVTTPLWINIPSSNSSSIAFTWPQTTTDGSVRVTVSNGYNCGTQIVNYLIVVMGALPVELLYFDGHEKGNWNLLEWSTASEHNSDYFLVEVSTDGESWESVSYTDASSNSNQKINYSTLHAFNEYTYHYYRLLQYDFDGYNKTYGPISVNNTKTFKKVSYYINSLGQIVQPETNGLIFEVYVDGTVKRIIR